MTATARTAIASALVVGSGLVLWMGAPIVPAVFGCTVAVAVVLVREWWRPDEG